MKISVKDIIEKNEKKNSGFSGFIKKFLIALLVIFLVGALIYAGYYFYKEYKVKEKIEQIFHEKIEGTNQQQQQVPIQITDASGNNQSEQNNQAQDNQSQDNQNQDSQNNDNLFIYDIDEVMQNFNIEQIEEYLNNNEQFQNAMTEEEKEELSQMIEELKRLYNMTGVFSSGNQ